VARIVIADDSPTLRRIVTSVLTRDGHEVVAAEDGIGAVQAVLAHQPDAVVLDVQMPRVSGFIAARLLKDDWQTADIPILMLTSLDAASDRYWAGQAGADRYLTKDFEAGDLTGAVAEVLAAGRGPLRADPVSVTEEDVLSRVCDLLDRKLFETSVAQAVTSVAATSHGLAQTVASLLAVLERFVGYDVAAVLLGGEHAAYVAVAQDTGAGHYADFLARSAESLSSYVGARVLPADLVATVTPAGGTVLPDDLPGPMATYVSMPLRGHAGATVGVLALSSARPHAFGETALSTLKLLEGPAALVVDGARLAGRA
jgi:twitching motility two-component system response regulator PilH